MEPHRTDLLEAGPNPVFGHRAWVAAVVVLAIALGVAIIVALHYHAEAVAAGHRPRQVSVVASPGPGHFTLSAKTATLPASGRLTGQVTIFSVQPANGAARVEFSGRISGGIPRQRYAIVGNDCSDTVPDHPWATGVADTHGRVNLSGPAWTVSAKDEYWLWLVPWPHSMEPGLHGSLTPGGSLTVFRSGWAPCTPG